MCYEDNKGGTFLFLVGEKRLNENPNKRLETNLNLKI